jgi:hypothetical protein
VIKPIFGVDCGASVPAAVLLAVTLLFKNDAK